jgi:hypothetical protein
MRRAAWFYGAIVAAVCFQTADASAIQAFDLYRLCKSSDEGKANSCFHYVFGTLDALKAIEGEQAICLGPVTETEIVEKVTQFLSDRLDEGATPGAVQVMRALKEAYPCK